MYSLYACLTLHYTTCYASNYLAPLLQDLEGTTEKTDENRFAKFDNIKLYWYLR